MKSTKHSGNIKAAPASSMENYVMPCRATQLSDLTSACKAHELVADAEILWTMNVITSHHSCSSFSQTNCLSKRMFPDSEVAKASACGKKKCAYVACHGLRPLFFLSSTLQDIENCDY